MNKKKQEASLIEVLVAKKGKEGGLKGMANVYEAREGGGDEEPGAGLKTEAFNFNPPRADIQNT